MDFALAKELKDAGFPNIRIGDYFEHRVGSHSDDYGGESDAPCYCNKDRFPTLEELVEACGDDFGSLEYDPVMGQSCWIAMKRHIQVSFGSPTPTEAVARLWLSLNKNKSQV